MDDIKKLYRIHFELYIDATLKSRQSINHYIGGIDNVEKTFSVDVDEEYQKDRCESVVQRIKDKKHFGELVGNDTNMGSYLNKYIAFRDEIKNIEQDFIEWFDALTKDNSDELYKDGYKKACINYLSNFTISSEIAGKKEQEYKWFYMPRVEMVNKVCPPERIVEIQKECKEKYGNTVNSRAIEFYIDFLKQRNPNTVSVDNCNTNSVISQPKQFDKNIILYGPPGTGKTYNTVVYAVAIVEQKEKTFEQIVSEAKSNYHSVFERYQKYLSQNKICFTTFHQSYGYEEFIEGIKPVPTQDGNVTYKVEPGCFKLFCDNVAKNNEQNPGNSYVFVIDEINRGNISKIMGELITLIEPSKRIGSDEGMRARLPCSKHDFGVPDNVYIIGTMNTADRSIAAIDTALRRRFSFVEMPPKPEVVQNVNVEGISVLKLLEKINERIEALYDREHTIGHAYFTPLLKEQSLNKLADIFKNKIIPLLQEYFYEDYEKIRLVVADNQTKDKSKQFVNIQKADTTALFGSTDYDFDTNVRYEINQQAFYNIDAYKKIYDITVASQSEEQQMQFDFFNSEE